ncbi:serine carboxypeptidase [Dendrothele bispora CBS 962.96]|uniref:Carboxypeptidase n=1 Tax=Dendrothele bispora (strain CBS 962.96) TaxID=1314807 RepID=A0A4V4HBZ2_DENBC|nr:serine carboxypeptidase [Dendrothele bispora CBS 962.96]
MFFLTGFVALLGLFSVASNIAAAGSTQQPFQSHNGSGWNSPVWSDDGSNGLFTPLESLSVLKSDSFTTMQHPFFPKYSVRIKKSDFCDPTVNVYTGYIDIEARHIFFYFFESRNDPAKDDVIFWTNGGPGCSSAIGLFFELGPCRVLDDTGPKFHPESWNTNANIFFVDQPIGVGFSYADYGEYVATTEDAAKDMAAFVGIFFENFSQFKGKTFHMAGESYGGRYVPLFASQVYDQNARMVEAGLTPINLTSVMIGNGMTDLYTMYSAYYEMTCTAASRPPVLDIKTCVAMKQMLPRCEKWSKSSCLDQYDSINCGAAAAFCESAITAPFWQTGLNPYDISIPCKGGIEALCYPELSHTRQYLSLPSIRTKLGVDLSPSIPTNFSSCSSTVGQAFNLAQDILQPSTPSYVAGLLERGVHVLIYVGDRDWICNWLGNEKWTIGLEWSGQREFGEKVLRGWEVEGRRAGMTRSFSMEGGSDGGAGGSGGRLTFATVEGAGHMVPYNRPKEALVMVQRWIAGEEL